MLICDGKTIKQTALNEWLKKWIKQKDRTQIGPIDIISIRIMKKKKMKFNEHCVDGRTRTDDRIDRHLSVRLVYWIGIWLILIWHDCVPALIIVWLNVILLTDDRHTSTNDRINLNYISLAKNIEWIQPTNNRK